MRKIADIFSTMVILASIAVLAVWLFDGLENEFSGPAYVVDGDSLVMNEEKIRLEGIDAPELHQTCTLNGVQYPCGVRARSHLRQLVKSGQVRCSAWQRDNYERLLGQCFVGETNINARMVSDGWAVAFGGYYEEQNRAKKLNAGIWAGEFERPSDWRYLKGDLSPSFVNKDGEMWWKFWQ